MTGIWSGWNQGRLPEREALDWIFKNRQILDVGKMQSQWKKQHEQRQESSGHMELLAFIGLLKGSNWPRGKMWALPSTC
jgi:hypothetical protein